MIFITKFKVNDLQPSKGRQIEFSKYIADTFFQFTEEECAIEVECSSVMGDLPHERIRVGCKLSPARGDYKIYQNPDGTPDLKDWFLSSLGLDVEKNIDDYYAIKRGKSGKYSLYYIPKDALASKFLPLISGDVVITDDVRSDAQPLPKEPARGVGRVVAAMRTKPFVLLAGISGTGKSRVVKEMAFACCPRQALGEDTVSPGNYCLVEVKPSWTDSTELLGYECPLDGGSWRLTKFTRFLIKAMRYPKVPFFVCLDEMNLAPVEQYFAEFLSVMESRKDTDRGIVSEPLVDASIFVRYEHALRAELSGRQPQHGIDHMVAEPPAHVVGIYERLKSEGLRIPPNVIVVGTVNMDDTTFQFSRKVIDRAMTIEMNEVDLDNIFKPKTDTMTYRDAPADCNWFVPQFAQSRTALGGELLAADRQELERETRIAARELDEILGGTPFRVAYRVVNELVLHFAALRWERREAPFAELFAEAVDNILMMKVLPRVEGNKDVVERPLQGLAQWTKERGHKQAADKAQEMLDRLMASRFTGFWP